MKLWLDDLRPIPPGYTHHVKTAEECIELLKSGEVEEISLDHDLGHEKTGYDVAKWIEANAANIKPMRLRVHSQNPVGVQNIKAALRNAKRVWINREND